MGIRCASIAAGVFGIVAITQGASAQCKAAETDIGFYAFDLESEGSRLYAAAEEDGLRVVDVADPSRPVEIGGFFPEGLVRDVAVSNNIAYIVVRVSPDPLYEMVIVDMQDPAKPVELGVFTIGNTYTDIFVSGNTAFVTAGMVLHSIDVSDPSLPVLLGELNGIGSHHTAVQGHFAYITDNFRTRIVDIQNPAQMVLLSETFAYASGFRSFADGVAVVGDYMFVGGRGQHRSPGYGLNVFDVSDPTNPIQIAHKSTILSGLYTLVVSGSRVYAVADSWEIVSFDISNPADPRFLGARPMPQRGHGLAASGKAIFASLEQSLLSYRIEDGCAPCLADTNDDGSLDTQDFDAWLRAYLDERSQADQNLNGVIEPSDFTAWIAHFNTGCDF